jgi:hypothetical protein
MHFPKHPYYLTVMLLIGQDWRKRSILGAILDHGFVVEKNRGSAGPAVPVCSVAAWTPDQARASKTGLNRRPSPPLTVLDF